MTNQRDLINGMLIGACAMYLMDPDRGRRRRKGLRDRMGHLSRRVEDGLGTAMRDLGNRGRGMVAEARYRIRREPDLSEHVLAARVRSELGRLVSHPRAIEVRVEGRRVEVSGPILEREVNRLLSGVLSVKGVEQVTNHLTTFREAGDLPALQGSGERMPHRFELLQENWSPGARLVMTLAGGALALRGVRRGGLFGGVAALLGLTTLARAATNLETRRLVGVASGRRAVEFHRTLNVNAPVETVFSFWRDYENFPRFMSHVREVRDTGGGRSHWVAAGPGGLPVSWDAETTAFVENRLIGWRTIGHSPVKNAGLVRFQPNDDGSTRIDISLSYNPPGGALGHLVAAAFGSDPRHAMIDDLVRLKTLLEQGRASADGWTT